MPRHVHYYELVDVAYPDAAATLASDPSTWLPQPASPADGGWEVDLRANGALPGALATRRAIVRVGPVPDRPVVGDAGAAAPDATIGLLRPLRWEAATAEDLFPVLSADLELVPLQGEGCQLTLMGSYRPPLSAVGDATDRLLGHRVAEATVRRFVLDVAARLGPARD